MNADNFIKQIDEIKKENKLDLSTGEDLSIALMNIISLEEHFLFSYFKTSEKRYLDMLEKIRELRKKLLKKIVRENKAEDWCISKHLLASSMRLIEVGTKYMNRDRKEAEGLFIEAFNLYSLFWGINGVGNIKSEKTGTGKLSKLSNIVKKILDCCKE